MGLLEAGIVLERVLGVMSARRLRAYEQIDTEVSVVGGWDMRMTML